MARPRVPSTRSQYSIKAAEAIINLDSDPDSIARDAKSDIAEIDIIFD